jgi:lysophospholipase L1-like esterase
VESVLVLGDSFTFGRGVNDTETCVSRLNAQRDEWQFINFGVPGTSTDQQLLMMESASRQTAADRVLLVTYLANDLVDIMLDYPLQAAYGKPRFELSEEGELVLVNVPVPQQAKPPELAKQSLGSYLKHAGGNSGALRRWRLTRLVGAGLDAVPEDFEKTLEEQFAAHLELYRSMLSAMIGQLPPSSRPLEVLLLPGSELIQGSGTISNRYQQYLLGRIMEIGETTLEDVRFIDCTGALQGAEQRLNYPNDGHLTKNGHQVVADCLRAELRL